MRLFAYAAGTVKWQVTDAVFDRGVVVTSAAAANAVPVADYAFAAILLANKGVFLVRELLRAPEVKLPLNMARVGNCGARVGIVGASFVGRIVIDRLRDTDLVVSVYDPYFSAEEAGRSASPRSTTSTTCVPRSISSRSTCRTFRRPVA